jgi:hypothetical protein
MSTRIGKMAAPVTVCPLRIVLCVDHPIVLITGVFFIVCRRDGHKDS